MFENENSGVGSFAFQYSNHSCKLTQKGSYLCTQSQSDLLDPLHVFGKERSSLLKIHILFQARRLTTNSSYYVCHTPRD